MMKKQILLLLALLLACELPAMAFGRFGGGVRYGGGARYGDGARYSASRTAYHPATGTITHTTRSVGAYQTGAYAGYHGAYRGGAYATAGVYRPGVYHPYAAAAATTALAVGYRAAYLPAGYSTFYYGATPYYYYGGDFYTSDNDGYVVVQPPVGATVQTLPPGATLVEGQSDLYVYNGVYYRSVYQGGGVAYIVTNP
ncbi:MAG: hypothetical protein KC800_16255 [Candidatus Eremiobacteraeota bacterium]|nr:hypothetical protein [Candidatus Eremiobacteraeota bacterium]